MRKTTDILTGGTQSPETGKQRKLSPSQEMECSEDFTMVAKIISFKGRPAGLGAFPRAGVEGEGSELPWGPMEPTAYVFLTWSQPLLAFATMTLHCPRRSRVASWLTRFLQSAQVGTLLCS